MIRKLLSMVLALCLLVPLSVKAAQSTDIQPYVQRMIRYYQYYQEQADAEIETLLQYISSVDPEEGAFWRGIMDSWSYIHSEMPVATGVLPEGLPEGDNLCIVVMGYGLNPNGSMKPELLDRLEVALASAQRYSQAYIAVTGGETSRVPGISEAGEMAAWLKSCGIPEERLIVEDKSLTTTENARNVSRLLAESYPQVDSIAVVTSDYHVRWSGVLFAAVAHQVSEKEGGKALQLVGNAGCETGTVTDSMYSQAWGISLITGIPFDQSASIPSVPLPLQTEPETVPESEEPQPTQAETVPAQAAEDSSDSFPLWVPGILLAAALFLLIPRKPRKRREMPQWKDPETQE